MVDLKQPRDSPNKDVWDLLDFREPSLKFSHSPDLFLKIRIVPHPIFIKVHSDPGNSHTGIVPKPFVRLSF